MHLRYILSILKSGIIPQEYLPATILVISAVYKTLKTSWDEGVDDSVFRIVSASSNGLPIQRLGHMFFETALLKFCRSYLRNDGHNYTFLILHNCCRNGSGG